MENHTLFLDLDKNISFVFSQEYFYPGLPIDVSLRGDCQP
jgi:hypothetical protein